MLKKILTVFCFIVILFSRPGIASSKLDDFKDDAKKEAKEKRKSSTKSGESDGSSIVLDPESTMICLGFAVGTFVFLGVYNFFSRYNDYPYFSEKDAFAVPPIDDGDSFFEAQSENEYGAKLYHNYYNISAIGQYLDKTTYSLGFDIETKFFFFFWPIINHRTYLDNDTKLNIWEYGLNFSIFQYLYFAVDFFFFFAYFNRLFTENVFVYGLYLRLFPFKPIELKFKYGTIDFDFIEFINLEA